MWFESCFLAFCRYIFLKNILLFIIFIYEIVEYQNTIPFGSSKEQNSQIKPFIVSARDSSTPTLDIIIFSISITKHNDTKFHKIYIELLYHRRLHCKCKCLFPPLTFEYNSKGKNEFGTNWPYRPLFDLHERLCIFNK